MPRARRTAAQAVATGWEPLPGFLEVAPNVWYPDDYERSPFELPSPVVETQAQAAVEYVKCHRSLPYFATTHCWTLHVDDRDTGIPTYRKVPNFSYVREFLGLAQNVENFHIEKSRQLLFSWMWMVVFLWDILFHDKWGNVAFSTIENLVDDGGEQSTPDSLFGKVRTIWTGLPPYLRADITFRHMLIQCPSTGSYIRGRAATPKGGRGPAYKRGLMDEAAHMERGTQLYHGLRASVKKGLILNSTPLGKGNIFAQIRFKAGSTFRRLTYHWSRHPELARGMYCECGWHMDDASALEPHEQFAVHDCIPDENGERPAYRRKVRSPWYDTATADFTPEQIASEYDLSYEKSQRGRVYEVFDSTRHVWDYQTLIPPRGVGLSSAKYREQYLRAVLKPGLPTVIGMDFGVGDPTSVVLGQELDPTSMHIDWLDSEEWTDKSWSFLHTFLTTFWAPIIREVTGSHPIFYGDPAGKARNAELTSWITNLADAEPKVIVIHSARKETGPGGTGTVIEWLDFIRERMRRGDFSVSLWCSAMIDARGQYHFPLDGDGNPVPGEHLPVHDQWCHRMDAMRYVYKYRYAPRLRHLEPSTTAKRIIRSGSSDKRHSERRRF